MFLTKIARILTIFKQSSFLSEKQGLKKSRKEINIFRRLTKNVGSSIVRDAYCVEKVFSLNSIFNIPRSSGKDCQYAIFMRPSFLVARLPCEAKLGSILVWQPLMVVVRG
jgi:hypothetical protein